MISVRRPKMLLIVSGFEGHALPLGVLIQTAFVRHKYPYL